MNRRSTLLERIIALALCLFFIMPVTDSNVYAASDNTTLAQMGFVLSETGLVEESQVSTEENWVINSDSEWEYTFDTLDDPMLDYVVWESDVPTGYWSDHGANKKLVLEDGERGVITNTFGKQPIDMFDANVVPENYGLIESYEVTQDDKWSKDADKKWSYQTTKNSESATWIVWESVEPEGYTTTQKATAPIITSGDTASITNTSDAYTLTIKPDGGMYYGSSATARKTVKMFKKDNNAIGVPTKNGFRFDGWYCEDVRVFDENGYAIDGSYWKGSGTNALWKYAGNITVKAKWAADYKIAYAGMEGATHGASHPVDITGGQQFKVDHPSRLGYDFAGWRITGMDSSSHIIGATTTNSTTINSTKETTFKNLTLTGGSTVTFTATWAEKSTAAGTGLKYDANGHGTAPAEQTMKYTQEAKTAGAISATGWTFKRWNTLPDNSGNAYAAGAVFKNANSLNNTAGTTVIPDGATLYAIWEANPYNISYNLNGGSYGTNHPTTAKYGSVVTIDNPVKTGWTFAGWNITGMDGNTHYWDASNGTSAQGESATAAGVKATKFKNLHANGGNVTFTAVWTRNLTFKSGVNGATSGTVTQTLNADGTYTSVTGTTPATLSGWTFLGWRKDTNPSAKEYSSGANASFAYTGTDSTFYAVYSRTLTINYNAGEGSGTAPANTTATQYYNSGGAATNVSKPSFQLATNTFTGPTGKQIFVKWDLGQARATYNTWGPGVTDATTKTATAQWDYNTYTVTFKSGSTILGSQKFTYETAQNLKDISEMTNLPVAASNGWTFAGWSTDANASVEHVNKKNVKNLTSTNNGTVTLYGVWTRNVSFKYFNGAGATTVTTSNRTQTYSNTSSTAAGVSAVSTYPLATQSTYNWAPQGWVLNSNTGTTKASSATTNTADIKPAADAAANYTALYKRTAKIAYQGNGNTSGTVSNTTSDQFFNAGSSSANAVNMTLAENKFAKTGYSFKNWALGTANGTQKSEGTEIAFPNTAWASSDTYNAYAVWQVNSYTIAYEGMSGATYGTSHPTNTSYDSPVTIDAPTKLGYTFKGWAVSGMDGTTHLYGTSASDNISTTATTLAAANTKGKTWYKNLRATAGTVTFNATWDAHTYKIKYVLNEGSSGSSAPTTATFDSTVTISNPVREGYVFNGWTITGMDNNTHYWDNDAATTPQTNATGVKATKFKNLTATNGNEITFTAVWSPSAYTISYNLDGGTHGSVHPTEASFDTAFTVTHPTKEGYDFAGWDISGIESGTVHYWDNESGTTARGSTGADSEANMFTVFKNLRKTSGKVTFTATWEEQTATVNYYTHHGTAPSPQAIRYTQAAKTTDAVNATGYTFLGWSRTANGEKEYNANETFKAANSIKNTLGDKIIPNGDDLYAVWKTNTYKINYDLKGGTHGKTHPDTATFDSAFTVSAPTKTGYTFDGWKITGMSNDCTHTYGSDTTSATSIDKTTAGTFKNLHSAQNAEVTFTAVWKANTYEIEYVLGGGNHGSSHPNEIDFNSSFTVSAPTRTGYVFEGWKIENMSEDCTHYYGEDSTTATSISKTFATEFKNLHSQQGAKVRFTALWKANTYKVTYDLNTGAFGTGTSHPETATFDVAFNVSAPTKLGYAFDGWKITGMSDDCDHVYGSDTTRSTSINATKATSFKNLHSEQGATVKFEAQWSPIIYNISYNLDGGTHGNTHPDTATYDSEFSVSAPTRLGYTFAGWDISGMDTSKHYYGSTATNATALSNITATTFRNLTSKDNATITFKAKWTPIVYNISYNLNGGTHGTSHPESGTYGTVFTLNNPSRTGYYFEGWNISGMDKNTHYWDKSNAATDQGKSETASEVKDTKFKNLRATTGTVTFEAQWREMTATVQYNANGHGSAPANQTIRYSEEAKTPSGINATGWTFKEWNTNDEGTGHTYLAGAKFKNANSLTSVDNEPLIPDGTTLYAIWTEDTADLVYHSERGVVPEPFTMRYTKQAVVAENLSAKGYIFKGWNSKADGTGEMFEAGDIYKRANDQENVLGEKVLPEGADLYAIWEEMSGTLTYDRNGHGNDIEPVTMLYSKETKTTVTENVEGYTFKDWNTRANGQGESYAINETFKEANSLTDVHGGTVIPSGAKLYAIWTELTGVLTYDANGHGTAPEAVTMRYSTETKVRGMNNVEGYVFMGWATTKAKADAGEVEFVAKDVFKAENSIKNTKNQKVITNGAILYAVWVEDEGILTYDANGHGEAPEAVHIWYAEESKVSSKTMKTEGFTFKEWNTKADGTGKAYKGGDIFKEEKTFDNTNGEKVIPSGDTLYAIWIENTATLTYNLNYDGSTPLTSTMKYTKEEKITSTVPSRGEGWTFKEWNAGKYGAAKSYHAGDVYKKANTEPKDGTLYAIWEEETATLTYHSDHGTVPQSETIYYSKEYRIAGSVSEFGYVFKGWSRNADGSGTLYQPGDKLKDADARPTNIDLYAVWQVEQHTMTVKGNGGTPDSKTYTMTVNSSDNTTVDIPSLSGKECTGLYTRQIGGVKVFNNNGKVVNDGTYFDNGVFIYHEDITLYAQYGESAVKCVIYDKNTDDAVSNMPTEESKYLGIPIHLSNQIPKRDGYAFVCWCTTPDPTTGDCYYIMNGEGSVFPKGKDADYNNYATPVTLYAIWKQNQAETGSTAKMDVRYNIYSSDVENGLLDAEIEYSYRNLFMQEKTIKVRRTIFTDPDQEIAPDVVISNPSWFAGDAIPGFENLNKDEKPTPTTPDVQPDEPEPKEYTSVSNEAELKAAIKDFDYRNGDTNYIALANDIELSEAVTIPMDANVSLDLETKTLSSKAKTIETPSTTQTQITDDPAPKPTEVSGTAGEEFTLYIKGENGNISLEDYESVYICDAEGNELTSNLKDVLTDTKAEDHNVWSADGEAAAQIKENIGNATTVKLKINGHTSSAFDWNAALTGDEVNWKGIVFNKWTTTTYTDVPGTLTTYEGSTLNVLGNIAVSNGTLKAGDACVTVYGMGNFSADSDVTFDENATYGVYFEKGSGSAIATLSGTTVDSTVLCGTENEHSLLTAQDNAKVGSEALYSDFTTKNPDGLVLKDAYTNVDPTGYYDDIEYSLDSTGLGLYGFKISGRDAVTSYIISGQPNDENLGFINNLGGYQENSTATLEAVPVGDYAEFVEWQDNNGNRLSKQNPWSFKVTNDLDVTAVFRLKPHQVNVLTNDSEMGMVSGEGEYGETEDVVLTATPKTGYGLLGWKEVIDGEESGEFIGTSAALEIVVPDHDVTYKAYFGAMRRSLQVVLPSHIEDNVVSVKVNGKDLPDDGRIEFDHGDKVTLVAEIAEDKQNAYSVAGWADTESSDYESVETTHTFNITEDTNLTLVLDLTDEEVRRVINNFGEQQKDRVESQFATYQEEYLDKAQPIGSIYTTTSEAYGKTEGEVDEGLIAVQDQFGGKWERIENTFLIAAGDHYDLGATGGKFDYELALAMNAGNGEFSYVPSKTFDYQAGMDLETIIYNKFGVGTGHPSGSIPVIDEEQEGRTTKIVPPYQSVYVFKRVDEFKGKENGSLKSGYYMSKPPEKLLANGYLAKRLTPEADEEKYSKGYRYKIVDEFDEVEDGSLQSGYFKTEPPAALVAEGYTVISIKDSEDQTDIAMYQDGYRYKIISE